MSTTTTLFRLPIEFADQLKAVAGALDKTVVEVVRDYLEDHKNAGTITRDLRGVGSTVIRGFLLFQIDADDGSPIGFQRMTAKNARDLAKAIDDVITTGKAQKATIGGETLGLVKVGMGFAFIQGDKRRTMAATVAPEVARHLMDAAAEVERVRPNIIAA
ncbi:hypothetical protein U0C82_01245 [Fulvimarina sp. 2208YS6-2-32]|uniref:Uncharacterized protein n=1 Tax=Fulvimarina uroteuthidis TaxID=3098149 RepID=A0ABU5HXS9_9HYPH|nr:hypothetical protein [Fulvimarina sp. 2208YS6-2-32]MDY8107771.1 hypothetical protein [Fulvimarina sp. 2208YS6-2-32]